ncbi:conserved membrane hypothetical protein [Hyella patelloides LEGE 07179]|uniref:Glycosyltransferase RgtA/B/C/D-like domain-containing protein n=1 Tax=Hyella patelloides LEGE 07179 TaxID=945734 RepID=A0A563VYI8_9CYAN|nr:glycosyltransferase family 39 protein [Hyella patelloides]VEP16524.1 conserved membrane hypothetical protein [Hyella patelloides LEGE 07179]
MTTYSNRKAIVPQLLQYVIITTALLIVSLGIFVRFHNLEEKIYWLDESFTSLSISGYSRSDVKEQLITGKEVDISTIMKYQYPNDKANYQGTIQGLIEDEPQHTPIYFLTARFWTQIFGKSIGSIRTLSVVAGILCLPLMYLLCYELFNQPLTSWMATAFMAVSPFHVLYSQEARPFSLWTLTTLVSCVALLKVQKKPSIYGWLIYSYSMIISCYTFLFSLLTYLAHFIYILVSGKFRLNQVTITFCITGVLNIVGFLPWIIILIKNPPSNYTSLPASSIIEYPKAWIRNLSLPFADFNINASSDLEFLIPFLLYLVLLLLLISYSLLYLAKNGHKKAYFFLFSLIFIPFLILLLRDFGQGGQMTLRANYLIPSLLGIQIICSYTLSNKLLGRNPALWLNITAILLSISIASCSLMTSTNVWWIKDRENIHHRLANIVNESKRPLIISDVLTDDEFIRPFSVSHYLRDTAKFMFLFEPTADERWQKFTISGIYSDVFLYDPSESLKNHLIKNYGYRLVPLFDKKDSYHNYSDQMFFRLEPNQN